MTTKRQAILVDRFGALKARADIAYEKAEKVRKRIAHWGDGAYDGSRYRSTVSTFDVDRVNSDLLAARLRKLLSHRAYTKLMKAATKTTPCTKVLCTSRRKPKRGRA